MWGKLLWGLLLLEVDSFDFAVELQGNDANNDPLKLCISDYKAEI